MKSFRITLQDVEFIDVLKCSICKELNTHGSAIIEGHIQESEANNFMKIAENDKFSRITAIGDEGNERVIFSGVIESVRIEKTGLLIKAEVVLAGGTKLLESVERTRTFQDNFANYEEILSKIDSNYSNASHIMNISDKEKDKLIVQYRENDWEFIKRIASHFNTGIVPCYTQSGSKYYIGISEGRVSEKINATSYSIENNLTEFEDKTKNNVEGLINEDTYYYKVKSREIYELGTGVKFLDKELYIYSVSSELIGAELVNTYQLKRLGGFKLKKRYNKDLVGASLDATIIDIQNDTVKVCVSIDGTQDKSTAIWFPYSTVYSSPDGTGWYCMPENGDSVRLYFPNEHEEEGYIISAIHKDEGNSSSSSSMGTSRNNPDNKSITTKYNKKIELTPTTITMTNSKGMSVVLDDKKGITIVSDKDVNIQSDGKMSLKSLNEKMIIEGSKKVELKQGDTKITLKDDVIVEGAMLKLQ